jgi:DNA-directed RNA polymerase specialized sigma24 family protein
MPDLDDGALRELLIEDAARGWRAFIDQYTPVMLALLERSGLKSRDDVMEVYVRACEHLAADDCARLRRHDPGKGALRAWLVRVVRNVLVDWLRSQRGRRRLFGSIRELDPLAREVFELYYWRRHTLAEIAELAPGPAGGPAGLAAVCEALDRIEQALDERQRSELVSLLARAPAAPLEDEEGRLAIDPAAETPGPEAALQARQAAAALEAALAELPPEDALIVSLRYVEGLSTAQVKGALGLSELPRERLHAILDRLRAALAARGLDAASTGGPGREPAGETP